MGQVIGPIGQLLQLGFVMILPILLGIALGVWLDGLLGTSPWLILAGLLLGAIVGGLSVYRLVSRVLTETSNR